MTGPTHSSEGTRGGTLERIHAPYTHLALNPGKNFRDLLIDAVSTTLAVPAGAGAAVRDCIAKLHVASMLIDDVEDNTPLRRGKPAAHVVYGPALTINCSHMVVFEAMAALDPRLRDIFLEEVLLLHTGQGTDIWWRDNLVCPSLDEYYEMVQNKTGGLLRMAFRMLLVSAEFDEGGESSLGGPSAADSAQNAPGTGPVPSAQDAFGDPPHPPALSTQLITLANQLGTLYQIRDDLLNLTSGSYSQAKGFCEDLSEGKFSWPVIDCLHRATPEQASQLLAILKKRPTDAPTKLAALELMRATQSLERCATEIQARFAVVSELAASIPGGDPIVEVLEGLVFIK